MLPAIQLKVPLCGTLQHSFSVQLLCTEFINHWAHIWDKKSALLWTFTLAPGTCKFLDTYSASYQQQESLNWGCSQIWRLVGFPVLHSESHSSVCGIEKQQHLTSQLALHTHLWALLHTLRVHAWALVSHLYSCWLTYSLLILTKATESLVDPWEQTRTIMI